MADEQNQASSNPYKPWITTARGVNSQGNRWDSRQQPSGPGYHYSNKDDSYYYQNGDGSKYYNDGKGYSNYTAPNGIQYSKFEQKNGSMTSAVDKNVGEGQNSTQSGGHCEEYEENAGKVQEQTYDGQGYNQQDMTGRTKGADYAQRTSYGSGMESDGGRGIGSSGSGPQYAQHSWYGSGANSDDGRDVGSSGSGTEHTQHSWYDSGLENDGGRYAGSSGDVQDHRQQEFRGWW